MPCRSRASPPLQLLRDPGVIPQQRGLRGKDTPSELVMDPAFRLKYNWYLDVSAHNAHGTRGAAARQGPGEINLAAQNGLYLVLLLLGGMVIPFAKLPGGIRAVAHALPSGALADVLRGIANIAEEAVAPIIEPVAKAGTPGDRFDFSRAWIDPQIVTQKF